MSGHLLLEDAEPELPYFIYCGVLPSLGADRRAVMPSASPSTLTELNCVDRNHVLAHYSPLFISWHLSGCPGNWCEHVIHHGDSLTNKPSSSYYNEQCQAMFTL